MTSHRDLCIRMVRTGERDIEDSRTTNRTQLAKRMLTAAGIDVATADGELLWKAYLLANDIVVRHAL